MTTYIGLWRGINVAGRTVKMADLTDWMYQAGCARVRTYLQSGNVVFTATGSVTAVRHRLEQTVARLFGQPLPVLVRTVPAWRRIVAGNPWADQDGFASEHLHVTFLEARPKAAPLRALNPQRAGQEAFACVADRIYLYCPHGYGNTKMSNTYFERQLKQVATTRNWRTVLALESLAQK